MTHAPLKTTLWTFPDERLPFARTTLHSIDAGKCGPPSIHAILDAVVICFAMHFIANEVSGSHCA